MKHLYNIATALLLLIVCATTAWAEDDITYTQVTKQSQIVDGGEYILVAKRILNDEENTYYATSFASTFSCTKETKPNQITNPLVLTFVAKGTEGRFFIYLGTQNFYATSYNKTTAANNDDENSNYRFWEIKIGDDYQATMRAYSSSEVSGINSRLYYSGGSNMLISYGPGDALGDLYLYRKTTPTQQVSVTISDVGYSTFCCDKALDFTDSGIEAYTATVKGYDINLNRIMKAPANTGLLLYKEGGTDEAVNVNVCAEETESVVGNQLNAAVTAYTVRDSEKIYVLSNIDNKLAFYPAETGLEIPAGKAYIRLSGEAPQASAKCLSFSHLQPTSITTVSSQHDDATFNISGQQTDSSYRGITIRNGKKTVNR